MSDDEEKKGERKLVKTYPGLPYGAGLYDDGNFYNCAPGQPSQSLIPKFTTPPQSLKEKVDRAIWQQNLDEARRLFNIFQRQQALGLVIISNTKKDSD